MKQEISVINKDSINKLQYIVTTTEDPFIDNKNHLELIIFSDSLPNDIRKCFEHVKKTCDQYYLGISRIFFIGTTAKFDDVYSGFYNIHDGHGMATTICKDKKFSKSYKICSEFVKNCTEYLTEQGAYTLNKRDGFTSQSIIYGSKKA